MPRVSGDAGIGQTEERLHLPLRDLQAVAVLRLHIRNDPVHRGADRFLPVKAGDRILFGKYSGNEIRLDGEEYLIMREDDVLGVLDAGPKAVKKAS